MSNTQPPLPGGYEILTPRRSGRPPLEASLTMARRYTLVRISSSGLDLIPEGVDTSYVTAMVGPENKRVLLKFQGANRFARKTRNDGSGLVFSNAALRDRILETIGADSAALALEWDEKERGLAARVQPD